MTILTWILCATVVGYVLYKVIRGPSARQVAQAVAYSAVPELVDLLHFLEKLQTAATTLTSAGVQNLHAVISLQLLYLHDVVGLVAAMSVDDNDSPLVVLSRIAFDQKYNWVDYTNQLVELINKGNIESTEAETYKTLLRESVPVVMALRARLADGLNKIRMD